MSTEQEMSPEEQEAVTAVYRYAANLMAEGKSDNQIIEALQSQGLDHETSSMVVTTLRKQYKREMSGVNKTRGSKNMLYGMLWAVGGTIVTVATYSAASDGGVYVVTYGAIIGGIIQFIAGAVQYSR